MTRNDDRITLAVRASASDLLAYLQRRVGAADASDLLGDTLVAAWRRVGDLPENPERARMWLFGIARNTVLNHARGQRRRRALAERTRAHSDTTSTSPAADDGAEVRDAIARLDPDLAEIVRLVHWERMTLVQASELLGIPDSTARSHYARAKQQLRVALGLPVAEARSAPSPQAVP